MTSTPPPPVDRPARVFHFADADHWQAQRPAGAYAPPGWESAGFIHCATRAQVPGVVARHLQGRKHVLALTLDAAALGDTLRYDWSEASGDWYPHVTATIPVAAVLSVQAFDPISGDIPE